MSCGRDILEKGAKGGRPVTIPSPNPLPQPLTGFWVGEVGAQGPAFSDPICGLGGELWGEGREHLQKSPWPSPHNLHPDFPACGLDFGSRFVKLVCTRGEKRLIRRKVDSLTFYRDYLHRENGRLRLDWQRLELSPPAALVATGYGKSLLKAHFPTITEIRAHFLGAHFQTGLDHFILLEMGGQDTKVLYIQEGRVFDFLTNDRCAAGTGRYLENMARFLKMPLAAFAAAVDSPIDISQTCAIFGESELVGHLLEGVDPARIAAGVNASVARRALAMVRRYRCPTLVFAGGVARNRAVVRFLRDQGDFRIMVAPYPQFTGALGCCLEACRELARDRP